MTRKKVRAKSTSPISEIGIALHGLPLKFGIIFGIIATLFTISPYTDFYGLVISLPAQLIISLLTPWVLEQYLWDVNQCFIGCVPKLLGHFFTILFWAILGFVIGWIIKRIKSKK